MITKIQRQNVRALIRQNHKPLLEIIEAYKSGEDVTKYLEAWGGTGGTNGAAIAEHLATLKPVPKRKTRKTRST